MTSSPTFDEYIGVHGYADDGDAVVAVIDIEGHHQNPTGNINGGVIISLADNLSTAAAGRAYNARFDESRFMVGVDLHAVMMANQNGGRIRGIARAIRVGRRITVVRTEVRGDDDRLLADVTTTHVPTG